jgi:hypothetical protein
MKNIILRDLYIDQWIDLNQQFLEDLMNHKNDPVLGCTRKDKDELSIQNNQISYS